MKKFLIFVNMIGGNYFNLVISPTAIILLAFLFLIFFLVFLSECHAELVEASPRSRQATTLIVYCH